jgi:hypothetical protein
MIRIARKEQHHCSLFALDFGRTGSVCGGEQRETKPMDRDAAELTVRTYIKEVRTRLDRAAGIARAADACAGAGFCDKAVEITLDIEQPLYEATTLMNAVSLINRIRKESQS